VSNRSRWLPASLLLAVPLLAFAQAPSTPPPLPRPNPRAEVPIPANIKPIQPEGLLHGFTLRYDQGAGVFKSKDSDTPGRTTIRDGTGTLSFNVGQRGFASVSVGMQESRSRSRNSAAFGSIWIDGDVETDSFRVSGGYRVLPNVSVGGSFGQYEYAGHYQYNLAVPRTPVAGKGPTASVFVNGFVPYNQFLVMTFGAAYHSSNQDYQFANNVPPTQRSESEVLAFDAGLVFPITRDLRANVGLTFNHTLSQSMLNGIGNLDRNWLAGSAGVTYGLNRHWELNARVSGWLDNSKAEYRRASVGLLHRF
jgi:hypothetical protein